MPPLKGLGRTGWGGRWGIRVWERILISGQRPGHKHEPGTQYAGTEGYNLEGICLLREALEGAEMTLECAEGGRGPAEL